MAGVNKKGEVKQEYPKLIRVEGRPGKVRVLNRDEENELVGSETAEENQDDGKKASAKQSTQTKTKAEGKPWA